MGTLLEQITALMTTLTDIKTECEGIVADSAQQAADYQAAETAQNQAGVSSTAVVERAQRVIAKIGTVQ